VWPQLGLGCGCWNILFHKQIRYKANCKANPFRQGPNARRWRQSLRRFCRREVRGNPIKILATPLTYIRQLPQGTFAGERVATVPSRVGAGGRGLLTKAFDFRLPKIAPKLWPEIFSQTSNTPPRSRRFSTAFINSGVGNRGGLEVAPLSGGFWLKAVCACHKQVNKLVKNPRGGPEVISLNIKDQKLDINCRYLFRSIIIFWK